jgi:hypothetical protein
MTPFDLIAFLIGEVALIIVILLFSKTKNLFLKDKQKSKEIIENISIGVLATLVYIILQKYVETIQKIPSLDTNSVKSFFDTLFVGIGNLFISTSIMLAVLFYAVYSISKLIIKRHD